MEGLIFAIRYLSTVLWGWGGLALAILGLNDLSEWLTGHSLKWLRRYRWHVALGLFVLAQALAYHELSVKATNFSEENAGLKRTLAESQAHRENDRAPDHTLLNQLGERNAEIVQLRGEVERLKQLEQPMKVQIQSDVSRRGRPEQRIGQAVLNVGDVTTRKDDTIRQLAVDIVLQNFGDELTTATVAAAAMMNSRSIPSEMALPRRLDFAPGQRSLVQLVKPFTEEEWASLLNGKLLFEVEVAAEYDAGAGRRLRYSFRGRYDRSTQRVVTADSVTVPITR